MLYPKTNKKRMSISLNGLWDFQFVSLEYSPTTPLENPIIIGVPSSYNDLFTLHKERDHVGKVVYEKLISFPSFKTGTWNIRLGSAGNRVSCYIDGELVFEHNGGFLPIDFEIPLRSEKSEYRLTVVLDNRLDFQTLPTGEIHTKDGIQKQITNYDFYNYIGLHRNVHLYYLPKDPIHDIVVGTTFGDDIIVNYDVTTISNIKEIQIINPLGEMVFKSNNKLDSFVLENPILWDIKQGNLYQIVVDTETDYYEEAFGVRHIEIKENKLLLNSKPVYLKGFGMHEDHITLGKGSISALNVRDFNLLKWINANSFRTSHYPYDEEMYYLADKYGILVINEMPAVGMNFWSERQVFTKDVLNKETQDVYLKQFDELIARDKNHPSVIMYSLANEANTHEGGALEFFEPLFQHARTKTSLPLMIVEWVGGNSNKVAHLADVIGLNRYIGWYTDFADQTIIKEKLKDNMTEYFVEFKKPIVLTEFGADTIAGLHKLPSVAFSEEFQVEFIKAYQETIKELDFVIGEHVWNFADFMTKQGLTRIDGNKKGVFTRDRQPKMVAHFLKDYWK